MAGEVRRDITVIGASAGGIRVLQRILAELPEDYGAAVFVVVHLAPESPSVLHDLLNRGSRLPVVEGRNRALIRPGTVTIAPPDQHLLLEDDRVVLAHGPRENRHRPSIDVLFRSAAAMFGPRVTGVVLSGMLDDGSAGLWAIKRQGGATVVQDPEDAEYPDMPRHAIELVKPDEVVSADELARVLQRIAVAPLRGTVGAVPNNMAMEIRMAAQNDGHISDLDAMGTRSAFTCPECGGTLWEVSEGGLRFRCHVGHAYTARTLAAEQTGRVEAALWAALRSLEESVRLSQRMAADARSRGSLRSAEFHDDLAEANEAHANMLRQLMTTAPAPSEDEAAAD